MSMKTDKPEINNEIEITVKVTVSDEDLGDILDTAFFDGISYWCNSAEAKEPVIDQRLIRHLLAGGEVTLYDQESDDTWTLTKEKFLAGLKQYLESDNTTCLSDGGIDTGEIDSEAADMIVQYALFGELVFG